MEDASAQEVDTLRVRIPPRVPNNDSYMIHYEGLCIIYDTIRTGGRVVQCTGLQIRKAVSSNLTLCSNSLQRAKSVI